MTRGVRALGTLIGTRVLVILVIAAIGGLLAGFLSPRSATSANYYTQLRFLPPAGYHGGYAMLTCGWHNVCTGYGVPDNALDWVDQT